MTRWDDDRLAGLFRNLSRYSGGIVALAGAVVLCGWALDIEVLKSVFPGYVTMKANTALAFFLSGIALGLLQETPGRSGARKSAGRAASLLVVLLGALTLLEYALGVNTGLDELLFREGANAVQTSAPGRMAPNTALNFVMAGVCLLLLDLSGRRFGRPSEWLSLAVFSIALLPFTGYLYGVPGLVGYTRYFTTMAVHTSVVFMILGLGMLFARPRLGWMRLVSGSGSAGVLLRVLLPLIVATLLLLGWLRLEGEHAGLYSSELGTALFVIIRVLFIGAIIVGVAVLVERLERVRDHALEALEQANSDLERRVEERTSEIDIARLELKGERDFVNRIMDNGGALILLIDRDGRIVRFNRACEEATGYKADEVLGKIFWEIILEPVRAISPVDIFREVFKEGQAVSRETLWRFRNGGTRLIRWHGTALQDAHGAVSHCVIAGVDVTQRHLDEMRLEALLQLNQMTQASLKELTDFVLEEAVRLTNSAIGYLAFTNEDESVLTMYSWSRSAMAQCMIQEKPIVYQVRDTGLWGEAVRQRKPVITNDYQAPNPLKKGYPEGHVPVTRHMNIPVMDEGRIVAVAGVGNKLEDYDDSDVRQLTLLMKGMWQILRRRESENTLKQLRAYLQNVVDSMPSVLVGVDLEGAVTHWNSEARRLTGLNETESRGRALGEVLPQLKDQLDKIRDAISRGCALENERMTMHGAEGEVHYYDLMVFPLVANGAQGAVVRLDDVTNRVQIEEMMVQTEKMMSVGGLAAGMAHEINNPLGGILQACQNIERRTSPDLPKNHEAAQAVGVSLDSVRAYLQERGILEFVSGIRSDGARAARIVADMLAFSRRSESRLAPANITEIVDTVLRLAANDYDLKKQYDFRNIRIERDMPPGLPLVKCDQTKIEQVLLNLVKNAAQAMAANGAGTPPVITIRIAAEPRHLCIEVQDNGPGMEEKVRRRVFEPFFTTKEVGVGTGLGLSVSYFIITRQHKGTMTVESAPGKGARFLIRLPLQVEE